MFTDTFYFYFHIQVIGCHYTGRSINVSVLERARNGFSWLRMGDSGGLL